MMHIATIHWKDDKWIDIQLKYLRRNIHAPFRTYAFLNDLLHDHAMKFDYVSTEPIVEHGTKLNLLADIIGFAAKDPQDQLIFMDGDAFPIAGLRAYISTKLPRHKFVAVQRRENNADCQPHPCFAATTVELWRQIRGDWKSGLKWKNLDGQWITDSGGNLLKILQDNKIDWYPMLRTNRKIIHPLFFSVYDNVIYHHGAGFRDGIGRTTALQHGLKDVQCSTLSRLLNHLPAGRPWDVIKRRYHPVQRLYDRIIAENEEIKNLVFRRIQEDDNFFQDFL